MLKTFLNLILMLCCAQQLAYTQVLMQFVNASPDTAYSEIDIYINGQITIDNLSFPSATDEISLDTNATLIIHVCKDTSQDTTQFLHRIEIETAYNSSQLFVFNALNSPGYTNTYEPTLIEWPNYLNTSQTNGYTDVSVMNAIGDLMKIDLTEQSLINSIVEDDVELNSITDYNLIESLNYTLLIQDSNGVEVFREINFDLATRGLSKSALHLIATGFYDTDNNNGASLQLMIVPDSAGSLIAFENQSSTLQFINNSYDPELEFVDLYIGNTLVANDLEFRTGSLPTTISAGIKTTIGVAPGSSNSAADTVKSYSIQTSANDQFQIIINGALQSSTIPFKPLELLQTEYKQEASLGYNVDIKFVNGCPDLPNASLTEFDLIDDVLFSSIASGSASNYESIIPGALKVNLLGELDTVKTYSPELSTSVGTAQTWIVSGVVDTSSVGAMYNVGIWIVNPDGGSLTELSQTNSIDDIKLSKACKIFPNPTSNVVTPYCLSRLEQVIISDALGNELINRIGIDGPIDLTDLKSGQYIIQMFTDKGISVQRLSVVKS